jgi:hypothetical protein
MLVVGSVGLAQRAQLDGPAAAYPDPLCRIQGESLWAAQRSRFDDYLAALQRGDAAAMEQCKSDIRRLRLSMYEFEDRQRRK